MKHNAHVIEWLWWEFKKDKLRYWFPVKLSNGIVIHKNAPNDNEDEQYENSSQK